VAIRARDAQTFQSPSVVLQLIPENRPRQALLVNKKTPYSLRCHQRAGEPLHAVFWSRAQPNVQ